MRERERTHTGERESIRKHFGSSFYIFFPPPGPALVPKFLVFTVGIVSLRASGKTPGVCHVNIIRSGKMGSPDKPSTKSNGLPFPGKCASWEEQGKTFLFCFALRKNQLSVKSNKGEIHIKIQWAC